LSANSLAKRVSQQEVPVALHDKKLRPGCSKFPEDGRNLGDKGGVVVIPNPGIEQIAQDIQSITVAVLGQEIRQGPGNDGSGGVQV
jgi:hypothetical protein